MPPGSVVYMSQNSAYINATIFLKWLQSQFVPRKAQGTVLLILDGHTSHCNSVEVLEFAEANDIILLCLPSHTTQFLQPLDRTFFKSFKNYYYGACNSFLRANPTRAINRLQFGKLLADAWAKAATVSNATSGFSAIGIYPYNPDMIPEYAFLNQDEAPNNDINHEDNAVNYQNAINEENQRNDDETISDNGEVTVVNENITPGKMLDIINPVPSTSKVNTLRKRSRQLAEILTSPEHIAKRKTLAEKKTELLAKKGKKKQKLSVAVTKNKRPRTNCDSSSDTEVNVPLGKDSDSGTDDENECVGSGENYERTTSKED